MNNLFYKIFYMFFYHTAKNVSGEDTESFPITSIGFMSMVLMFNFAFLQMILEIDLKFDLMLWGLTFFFVLLFSVILGVKGKYKKIYKFYSERKLENNKKLELAIILYISFSITGFIMYAVIGGFLKLM